MTYIIVCSQPGDMFECILMDDMRTWKDPGDDSVAVFDTYDEALVETFQWKFETVIVPCFPADEPLPLDVVKERH